MYETSKRILDITIACILVVVFLPVWLVVPILIYLDSPGPIIFRHRRIGKNGRQFWLYKFRTMVKDADDILHKKDHQLLAEFKKNDWKLENDPRITKFGRLLRSLTIDEFPQFYNVLKGEMSMVGPRAYVKEELIEQQKRYPETKPMVREILKIKPGISGPWQTSGRNEIPFPDRVKLDSQYAISRTLVKDVIILLKTPKAMLSRW